MIDSSDDYIAITPVALNPNTVLLNTTGAFQSAETTSSANCSGGSGGSGNITSTVVDAPANYTSYVTESLNSTVHGHGTGRLPLRREFYIGHSPGATQRLHGRVEPPGVGNWTESCSGLLRGDLHLRKWMPGERND